MRRKKNFCLKQRVVDAIMEEVLYFMLYLLTLLVSFFQQLIRKRHRGLNEEKLGTWRNGHMKVNQGLETRNLVSS